MSDRRICEYSSSRHSVEKPFTAYLPENLDLEDITRPAWNAYAAWVVSAVVFSRFMDRESDETTFVPLASTYIDKHIPAKVRGPLLGDLRRGGVLECDDLYYFGHSEDGELGKCLCYRLGADYRGAKLARRPISHRELLRKLATAWTKERAQVTDPTHTALRSWHDRVELTPNAPYGEHPLFDRMVTGERRFKVCPFGRVHTNVANLPAEYRQYLRLAGQELESIDVATSQPLILAILLREGGKPKGKPIAKGNEALLYHYSDSSLSDYQDDCLSGRLYDRIVERTGLSRNDVKRLFLAVIYGRPEHMPTRVGRAFRSLYPGVYDAVAELNARLGDGGLPRKMQRLESSVMIGKVAARLVRDNPEIPLLTVHDSVLVPAEYAELARKVIEEEWMSEFGVSPGTKRSVFTAPQPPRMTPEQKVRERNKRKRSRANKTKRLDNGAIVRQHRFGETYDAQRRSNGRGIHLDERQSRLP